MSQFDSEEVAAAAEDAARSILASGASCTSFSPRDMTQYVVLVGGGRMSHGRVVAHPNGWWVASNFGRAYQWAGTFHLQPEYVTEKFVGNRNLHTGAVLACFLNALSTLLVLAAIPVEPLFGQEKHPGMLEVE